MNRDIGIVDRAIQRHKDKVAAELLRREENLRRALLETEALDRQVKADQQKEKYRSDPSYRERKIAISTQWQKDNRDRYLELMANWRDANMAKHRETSREAMRKLRIEKKKRRDYDRAYYLANRDKKLEQFRAWYEANKDKKREYHEANKEKNIEASRKNMRKRRMLERQRYGMSLYMYNKLNKK